MFIVEIFTVRNFTVQSSASMFKFSVSCSKFMSSVQSSVFNVQSSKFTVHNSKFSVPRSSFTFQMLTVHVHCSVQCSISVVVFRCLKYMSVVHLQGSNLTAS